MAWSGAHRLPALLRAPKDAVRYIVEGEKDADALAEQLLVATTNPGGASKSQDKPKWSSRYNSYFAGVPVAILPDNDEAGEAHALAIAMSLHGIASSVRIVHLPDLPPKGDVSDWLASGGSVEELEQLAREMPAWTPSAGEGTRGPERPPSEEDVELEHRPPGFTDEDLALKFTRKHRNQLRYVARWGQWFIWNGAVWIEDDTLKAFDLSRAICRKASSACSHAKIAAAVASAKTVAAVERLAKADRGHAATTEQWDADPWLLNTPDGVVDLGTAAVRAHRPADYMTKITAAAPSDGKAGLGGCPLWHRFLDRVTGGDVELKAFLRRAAGYALTGVTEEHAMFFLYGTGRNGKGVFINTLARLLGGYATIAGMETFTASQNDRHPADLAKLRGARLVAAQETEEGRNWAETRIKALTGGDRISARFMRQDFFTYTPQFKLFIAGNHKPGLRNVDEAIRSRLNLVPFTVFIPAGERDAKLEKKLEAEWGAILHWAIDGCLEWQRSGLAPPSAVTNATVEYMAAEDSIGTWISVCCETTGYCAEISSKLYASYKGWAATANEDAMSHKRFSQALQARGYNARKSHGQMEVTGIRLAVPRPHHETDYDR